VVLLDVMKFFQCSIVSIFVLLSGVTLGVCAFVHSHEDDVSSDDITALTALASHEFEFTPCLPAYWSAHGSRETKSIARGVLAANQIDSILKSPTTSPFAKAIILPSPRYTAVN